MVLASSTTVTRRSLVAATPLHMSDKKNYGGDSHPYERLNSRIGEDDLDSLWSTEECSDESPVRIVCVEVSSKFFLSWLLNDLYRRSGRFMPLVSWTSYLTELILFDNLLDYRCGLHEMDHLSFFADATSATQTTYVRTCSNKVNIPDLSSSVESKLLDWRASSRLSATVPKTSALIFSCILALLTRRFWLLRPSSRFWDQPKLWRSCYGCPVKNALRQTTTSPLSYRLPRSRYQDLGFLEPSGRRLQVASCRGMQQECTHHFWQIPAAKQSWTTGTWSSPCEWRPWGHPAGLLSVTSYFTPNAGFCFSRSQLVHLWVLSIIRLLKRAYSVLGLIPCVMKLPTGLV